MKYNLSEKTPGIYLFSQIKKDEEFIMASLHEISICTNPRTIVIESWIIVDWLVRQLIISGINCLNLQNESFVPHYDLLPNSFIENLEILSNLKSCQEKLPPIPPEKITQFLVGSYEVYEFIKRESIETWNKIIELENKFLREKYNIEAENFIITQPRYDLTKYRFVSEKWLLSIKDVDKDWFNNAKRLNKVRNRAAHVRNESEILEAFGISGDNKISLLRNMCIEIITKSLGLVQNEK